MLKRFRKHLFIFSNVPRLRLWLNMEKVGSALAPTVRQKWLLPPNVDVLCVSKSFLSRFEILLELRSLAVSPLY